VILGTLALGRLDDVAARRLIGGIIVAMLALPVWRKWSARRAPILCWVPIVVDRPRWQT
jgi:hypothetical protein